MPKLAMVDRVLLQQLLRSGRIDEAQARDLVQALNLHQARDPRVRLPDILVKKEILTVAELGALQAQLEDASDPGQSTGVGAHAAAHAAAHVAGAAAAGPAAGGAAVRRPQRTTAGAHVAPAGGGSAFPVGMVAVTGMTTIALLGVLGWLLLRDPPDPGASDASAARSHSAGSVENSIAQGGARETAALPGAYGVAAGPSGSDRAQSTATGRTRDPWLAHLDLQCAIQDPSERVQALEKLAAATHGDALGLVRERLGSARAELAVAARAAHPALLAEVEAHRTAGELAQALRTIEAFGARYGESSIDGEVAHLRTTVRRDLDRECEVLLEEGKKAYQEGRMAEARTLFERVAASGVDRHVRAANRWLTGIQEALAGGTAKPAPSAGPALEDAGAPAAEPTPTTAAVPKPGTPRPGAGPGTGPPEDGPPNDGPEGGPTEATGVEEVAGGPEATLTPEARAQRQRITRLSDQLRRLLPSGKAALDEHGVITLQYDFTSRDDVSALDWTPNIEGARPGSPVRWVVPGERSDRVQDGVKIADVGIWRHTAFLLPPLDVEVHYVSETSFDPVGIIALAWIDEKGNGIATNLGQQTALVRRGQLGARQGPLNAISALNLSIMRLAVTPDHFTGTGHGRPTPARSWKNIEHGQFAIIWSSKRQAGVIEKLTITGRLDLDWAEERLR